MLLDKSSLLYYNNIAGLIKSMGLEYDATDFLLTYPAEISKFFYIMEIDFHLSLLGIQYK